MNFVTTSDYNSTGGAGQEGAGHYCAFDLAPGTFLSDQRNTMVAQQNLRNFAADYKTKVIPPVPSSFTVSCP